MAEVLGIFASSVALGQLAGAITSSVIKLKGYWDQVKDAPAEIHYLLQEIEVLSQILSRMQKQNTHDTAFTPNAWLQQCFNLCNQSATELSRLVEEMTLRIDGGSRWQRKVGCTKVVLKKDEIKILKGRLKSSIRLLNLALSYHTQ